MDPWQDRRTYAGAKVSPPSPTLSNKSQSPPICHDYPGCPKEERKFLNEIRAAGKNIPMSFKLSNGMKATDFSLQYIMKNHFKRKTASSKEKV